MWVALPFDGHRALEVVDFEIDVVQTCCLIDLQVDMFVVFGY